MKAMCVCHYRRLPATYRGHCSRWPTLRLRKPPGDIKSERMFSLQQATVDKLNFI